MLGEGELLGDKLRGAAALTSLGASYPCGDKHGRTVAPAPGEQLGGAATFVGVGREHLLLQLLRGQLFLLLKGGRLTEGG